MATITVTQEDNGRSIEARPGDEIVVLLPENATTGFRWQVDRADQVLVPIEPKGTAAPIAPTADPTVGRGGLRELRFAVKEPGTARLDLKHWREWEGDSSVVGRFSTVVNAQGSGNEGRP